jgi:hypothetical protein
MAVFQVVMPCSLLIITVTMKLESIKSQKTATAMKPQITPERNIYKYWYVILFLPHLLTYSMEQSPS